MEEADSLCDRIAIMNRGQVTATGTPAELKTALGTPDATLDDVFAHYSGEQWETGGNFRELSKSRRNFARLG
jgi:ABC-2 type transport system ATP-binding protein